MAKNKHYCIRKTHRWLGFILGIQFLLWTIGCLYFSWSNIDDVHGDFQHTHPSQLSAAFNFFSPSIVLEQLTEKADSILSDRDCKYFAKSLL